MSYFLQVFRNTPFWVYLIFISLIFLGIKARNPRVVPFRMLLVTPFLFVGWSLAYLIEKYGVTLAMMSVWITAIFCGSLLGWFFHQPVYLKIDKKKQQMTVPGTWSILVLSILLFTSKYSFGYLHAISPHAKEHILIFGTDLFISGTISGIFLGKFFCFWHKYRRAKS